MSRWGALLIAGLAAGCLGVAAGVSPDPPAPPAAESAAAEAEVGVEAGTASLPDPDRGAQAVPAELEPFPLPAPGESVQRRLGEDGVHRYSVPAVSGTYLRVVLWEQGSDVALRLLAPSGEVLAETEHPGRRPGALLLDALLDEGGEHALEVVRLTAIAKTELYRLRVEALRPATAEDRVGAPARQQAGDLLTEALSLMQEDREEVTRAAIELCQEALLRWREGGVPFGEAWTLHTVGLLYNLLESRREAAENLRGAVEAWETLPDPIGEGWSLLAWSDVQRKDRSDQGYRAAREALERSLGIWRGEGDLLGEAQALNELGLLYRYLAGQENAEESYLLTALEIRKREGDRPGQAETLLNLGVTYWYRGRSHRALSCYEDALALRDSITDERVVSKLLIGLATVYRRTGQLRRAIDSYTEAEPLVLKTGDLPTRALLLHNLAVLYHHLGEWVRSSDAYRKSLDLFRQIGDWVHEIVVLRNLGWLHYVQGDFDKALQLFEEALRRNDEAQETRDGRGAALALEGRGLVKAASGNRHEALADLTLALTIWRELGDRLSEAETLSEMAGVHLASGELAVARDLLQRANELNADGGDEMVEAGLLARMAQLYHATNDLERAARSFRQALEIFEGQRQTLSQQELRASFFAARRPRYEDYVKLLLELDAQRPGAGFDTEALKASEMARARGLVELLTETRIDLRGRLDQDLRHREEELEDRVTAVQRKMVRLAEQLEAAGGEKAALRQERQRLRQEQKALETEIRDQDPRYAEIVYPEPLGREQIQALLDPQTALLEYMLGDELVYLFVVTRSQFAVRKLGTDSSDLGALVEELRRLLRRPGVLTDPQIASTAHRLYRLLVEPASDFLTGIDHLVIVPDGLLYYLPFEVLVTAEGRQQDFSSLPYLLKDYSVSYAPSATALSILSTPRRPRDSRDRSQPLELIAFGDPNYEAAEPRGPAGQASAEPAGTRGGGSAPSIQRFTRLQGSRAEVEEIAGLFPPGRVKVYLGDAASETHLKTDPDLLTARRLHFATHGIVDEEEPSNSGLVLSLNEEDQDGFLQLEEIFDLEISARLVVLSACSTGLGQQLRGEGLIGLSRAFMYAGAPNLLVSLWRVEDEATARLMTRFYRQIASGLGTSEALRGAKLGVLTEDPGLFHPGQWSSFILIGSGG